MYIAFALELPLALLSVFCFFIVFYYLITTWRKTTNTNRLFNLVKLFFSMYSVFMNVFCAYAFFGCIDT
ncbi:MAG: hypothetical protein JWM14_2219 [Chitinophagaceae bacterium]|nr:hypothetical protein [Chitinophagaceae bacterium]